MSVSVLKAEDGACLYDSVSMTAFGPVFDDGDQADSFLAWVAKHDDTDVRSMSEAILMRYYNDYWSSQEAS